MLALTGIGSVAAGCSAPASPTALATPHSTPSASPASGHCASVRTTTPITDVPEACAALWAPYQVTEVPPPNILAQEHVPRAPTVVNKTNGAVSQAESQRWADASNDVGGWAKWAEANDQPTLLSHLLGPYVIAPNESQALSEGASISLPDCDLYPQSYALFSVGPDGRAFFGRKGLPDADRFVFVVVYAAPCSETIHYPDGRSSNFQISSNLSTVFLPGLLKHDPALGPIWFTDAGGNCQDPAGPPTEWCSR